MRDRSGFSVTATVAIAGSIVAVAIVASAAIAGVGAVDTAARAQNGADLAALAAARVARDAVATHRSAPVAACDAATEVAARNAVRVQSCELDSRGRATVTVSAPLHGSIGLAIAVARSARAGPAGAR